MSHPGAPGIVLHYNDLRDIIDDVSDARVFGGIHFRYDQDAGERQGLALKPSTASSTPLIKPFEI